MDLKLGLIGKSLSHSFSEEYFEKKFEKLELENCEYRNYELSSESELEKFLANCELDGFNVTIPYKKNIVNYLDYISDVAKEIGAVNTVIRKGDELLGDNTDVLGFRDSLLEFYFPNTEKLALILGTGGASAAVKYLMQEYGKRTKLVSRNPKAEQLGYDDIPDIINDVDLIVNTTPLGSGNYKDKCPELPYESLSGKYCYDLNYNPQKTLFLKNALNNGGHIKNGYEMLMRQAEASWKIWNNELKDKK